MGDDLPILTSQVKKGGVDMVQEALLIGASLYAVRRTVREIKAFINSVKQKEQQPISRITKEQYMAEFDLEFKDQVAKVKREIMAKIESFKEDLGYEEPIPEKLIPEETSFKVTNRGVVDTKNGRILRTIGEVLMATMM